MQRVEYQTFLTSLADVFLEKRKQNTDQRKFKHIDIKKKSNQNKKSSM